MSMTGLLWRLRNNRCLLPLDNSGKTFLSHFHSPGCASIFQGTTLLKQPPSGGSSFPASHLLGLNPSSKLEEICSPYMLTQMTQIRLLSLGNTGTESILMQEIDNPLSEDVKTDAHIQTSMSVAGNADDAHEFVRDPAENPNVGWRPQLAGLNHGLTFGQLFTKYNTSINKLQGSTVQCSVERLPRDMMLVDTGLKTPIIFLKNELALPENKQAKLNFGIQAIEEYDEPKLIVPKILEKRMRRKQIWTELQKIFQNKGIVEGTILNNVKGGFAVGLGGIVAFLPTSLRRGKKLKKTTFRILAMKEANSNIVLRELQTEKKLFTWTKLLAMRKNSQPIEGFVLQRVSGGYHVRLAGHDAFLPQAYRQSRRLETRFHIVSMNARNLEIVVREAGKVTPSNLFQGF